MSMSLYIFTDRPVGSISEWQAAIEEKSRAHWVNACGS